MIYEWLPFIIAINGFQLNEGKCKELRISFSRSRPDFDPIVVNSNYVECVHKAKMLGITFSVDLKWNAHVMTSYKHVTEMREHMVEIPKCCNVWPMFVRLKMGLKTLHWQRG